MKFSNDKALKTIRKRSLKKKGVMVEAKQTTKERCKVRKRDTSRRIELRKTSVVLTK